MLKSPVKDQEPASAASSTALPVFSSIGLSKQTASMQNLILADIGQLMTDHLRAAVLAERGKLWILLQNVALSLWNAINSLLLATAGLDKERREFFTAAIYGQACRPLWVVGDALVEVLEECRKGPGLIPQVSSLTFTPSLDDSNDVSMATIKQVVFLAIHILYVHQHWEKLIPLGLNFDSVTK